MENQKIKTEKFTLVSYPGWGNVVVRMTESEYKEFLKQKENGLLSD